MSRFKQNRDDEYVQKVPDGLEAWIESEEDRLVIGALLLRVAKVVSDVIYPALHHRVYVRHGFDDVQKVGFGEQAGMWLRIRHLEEMGERLKNMGEQLRKVRR